MTDNSISNIQGTAGSTLGNQTTTANGTPLSTPSKPFALSPSGTSSTGSSTTSAAEPLEYDEPPEPSLSELPDDIQAYLQGFPASGHISISSSPVSDKSPDSNVTVTFTSYYPGNTWWDKQATYTTTMPTTAAQTLEKAGSTSQSVLRNTLQGLTDVKFQKSSYANSLMRVPSNLNQFQQYFPREYEKFMSALEKSIMTTIIQQQMDQSEKLATNMRKWMKAALKGSTVT